MNLIIYVGKTLGKFQYNSLRKLLEIFVYLMMTVLKSFVLMEYIIELIFQC